MTTSQGKWKCAICQKFNYSRRPTCFCCGNKREADTATATATTATATEVGPMWQCCYCGTPNAMSRVVCWTCSSARAEVLPCLASCSICFERPADTFIKTCGHVVGCEDCAFEMFQCIICGRIYSERDIGKISNGLSSLQPQ